MKHKVKGPLLIVATAILWSFGGLLIKQISWDAMTIVGVRALFAAAVLLIYLRRWPRFTFTPSVIIGALCMSGTTILFIFANKLTTAANAIVLQYTAPIFVVILSVIFFKKRAKVFDIIAVVAVFFGVGLFFFDQLQGDALLGNILACLSGITFAGVFLMNQMPNSKPEQAVLLGYFINIVISIPFVVTNITFEPIAWISIVLLGIFQLGFAYVFFTIGIKLTPPISASLIATVEPLLSPIWVMLVIGERPGFWALIGGVIVIITIVIYNIVALRENKKKAATVQNYSNI